MPATREEIAGAALVKYAGETDDPLVVAQHVARFSPMHLIVNRPTLRRPLSVEIPSPLFLWNWHAGEVLHEISPILLSASSGVDLETVFRETWPEESLVCIFSRQEHEPLRAHLRGVIRGDDGGGADTDEPHDVFAIYLPQVLRGLLPQAASEALASRVEQLIACIDGLLVPADTPAEWELFCTSKFDERVGRSSA